MRLRMGAMPWVGVLLAACGSPPPAPLPAYAPRPVREVERWQVVPVVADASAGPGAGGLLGEVVLFEIDDPTGPVRFYRILDARGHWVGHATGQGRFSRRVPFREDEEDLGIWALPQGTAELLAPGTRVQLVRVPPAAPPASAGR